MGQAQISVDDSRLLREIVEASGLSRKEICQRSKVSAGWLSLLLGVKGQQPRTVEADMVTRLADVLVERLKNLSADQSLPEERLKTILGFLSRYTDSAAELMPPKIYTAGGPIPIDADHYINRKRQADNQLLSALQAPAFTMIVRGPVQTGKSSLLAQLEHKARAKGIETALFDPWGAVSSVLDAGKQPADIFALTANNLIKTLEVEWKLEPPTEGEIEFKEELSGWLLSALASADRKPRLLIVDDLGSLGADTVEKWLSFIRLIDTKRASRDIQISIAVGMTHHYGPYYARMLENYSSIVSWEPRIELGWLDEEQTAELEQKLSGKKLNLYKIFHGQPYLTHAAAMDPDFLESVELLSENPTEEKYQRPISGASPYKRHLKAIKFAILGPPWQDQPHSQRLVNSFVQVCRRSAKPAASFDTELHITWDDERFLKTAKLIDDHLNPELGIYRLIAEDLEEQMRFR